MWLLAIDRKAEDMKNNHKDTKNLQSASDNSPTLQGGISKVCAESKNGNLHNQGS